MIDRTVEANERLNEAFDGGVFSADLPELERLLKDTAEIQATNPNVVARTPRRAEFLKQLIQIRQFQRVQRSSDVKSNWTIGISLATLALMVVNICLNFESKSDKSVTSRRPTLASSLPPIEAHQSGVDELERARDLMELKMIEEELERRNNITKFLQANEVAVRAVEAFRKGECSVDDLRSRLGLLIPMEFGSLASGYREAIDIGKRIEWGTLRLGGGAAEGVDHG